MTKKIAFIWGDGAIKGGFIAAAGDEIARIVAAEGAAVSIMMASSASVGNILYLLSFGDDHPGLEMWTKTLASETFLRFKGVKSFYEERSIYDIHHLVDDIFRKQYPLNIERIKQSQVSFFFPVQDFDSGELVYFSNREDSYFERDGRRIRILNIFNYDVYDIIKAASAAPFVFDQTVNIGGRRYFDAAALEPLAFDLPGMSDSVRIVIATKGAAPLKKLTEYMALSLFWIIAVRPFRKNRLKIRHYIQYGLKPLRLHKLYKQMKDLEDQGLGLLVYPSRPLGSNFDNTPATLKSNYEEGLAAVSKIKNRLLELIQG